MTTQTKAADPMREARERFEKWCSDRGIASNYQGDGQYPAGVQLAFEAHMDAYAQAPRPCSCHPDDRPRGPCREKYAASECQAPAANGDAPTARELDMAMLIKRLAATLRVAWPESTYMKAADDAMDSLNRWGLAGSPLREGGEG